MKHPGCKNALALLFTLAVLTACLLLFALPASADETISVGDEIIINESTTFVFVPAKSGPYRFFSTGHTVNPQAYLRNSAGYQLSYNDNDYGYNFYIKYDLEAGQTYYFDVYYYSGSGSCTVCLEDAGEVDWSLENGVLTVSPGIEMDNYFDDYNNSRNRNAPWYSRRKEITSVVLEDGVKKIGRYAFWDCPSLTSVTIPDSVTQINDNAFKSCYALTSVIIPDGVNSIGCAAFFDCYSLRSAIIPDGVLIIDDYAFYDCGALESIVIPDSVTGIGDFAFHRCSALTDISIGKNVTEIGESAFTYCSSLREITIAKENPAYILDDGILYNKARTKLISCPARKSGKVTVPGSVTVIEDGTFSDCVSITSIVLCNGVTSIGNSAFFGCSVLKDITIPDSVTSIGSYSFGGCSSLTDITIPDSVTSIGSYSFSGCSSLTDITIPEGVTSLGARSFEDCTALTRITLPFIGGKPSDNENTYFGYIFDHSTSNESVPASLREVIITGAASIGYRAFSSCTSLQSVTVVKATIGAYAFEKCTSLSDLTIMNGVTEIGNYAFEKCVALTEVTIPDSVTTTGDGIFGDCTALTNVKIGIGVTSISRMFMNCQSLKDVTLPDGVSNIYNAFSGCTSLTAITVPGSVTDTGNAFYKCTALENITLKNGITKIGGNAFYYCESLRKITIPNSVTEIGSSAFEYCRSLTDITIPDSVTAIGIGAFRGCYSLQRVTIGDGVKTIGKQAFYSCIDMTDVEIGNSVTAIGEAAFRFCYALTRVEIPYGVAKIDDFTFYGCSSLESVFIPSSVTTIGNNAFRECTSLTDVIIPDSVTTINEYAFSTCISLKSIEIPASVQYIGRYAFSGCGDVFCEATENPGNWQYLWDYGVDTVHWGCFVRHRDDHSFERGRVTVYLNRNDANAKTDDYQLAPDVTILPSPSGSATMTDENGNATLGEAESYTFLKAGYVSRTLSAARLGYDQTVYLQKVSEDAPVISGVWVNEAVDVLTHPYTLDDTSTAVTQFDVEVDWGISSEGSIRLVQETRAVSFVGTTLSIVVPTQFNLYEPIYIEATDAHGRTARKKINLNAMDTEDKLAESLKEMDFDWGSAISIPLPNLSGLSLFENQTLKIGFPTAIPITYLVEDGKISAVIGADLVDYSDSDKYARNVVTKDAAHILGHEVENTIKQLKGNWDKIKDSPKQFKYFAKNLLRGKKYLKGSFIFDADFTMLGYMEGTYDKNGKVTWLDTGVILNPSVSWKWNVPFTVGPVPMFLEIAVGMDAQAKGNIYTVPEARYYTPQFDLSGELSLSAGLGVGVKKVLSASGGLTGKLNADYRTYAHTDNYFKLTASLEGYVNIEFLFFTYEWKPLKTDEITVYETGAAEAVRREYLSGVYDTANYHRTDLSYLNEPSYFVANEEKATVGAEDHTLDPTSAKDIAINTYRRSTPQYGILSDGRRIAVWLDSESDDVNGIMLYYSICDNEVWSVPEKVWDDGTTDYAPALLCKDGEVYLTWQNATRAFGAGEELTPESVSDCFDISIAIWGEDGFNAVTFQTEGLDTMPTLCAEYGTVVIGWSNNPDGSWFGEGTNNRILWCYREEGEWSEVFTAWDGLCTITSLAMDHDGYTELVNFAWCMDEDGDLSTPDDVFLYENGVRVTDSTLPESAPVYLDHKLYWYCDGGICSKDHPNCTGSIGSDNYLLFRLDDGVAAVYTEREGLTSRLMLSRFNEKKLTWSKGIPLTDGDEYIADFAGAVDWDDRLEILTNVYAVIGDMQSEEPYGSATLRLYGENELTDLRLGDIWYDGQTYCVNSPLWLDFELTNEGTIGVDDVLVQIFDEDGTLLNEKTMTVNILPGDTVECETFFIPAEEKAGMKITVTVTPAYTEDDAPTNNTAELTVRYEDIAVEHLTTGIREDGLTVISANIGNYGYELRKAVTVALRKDSKNGEIIATQVIDKIDSMDIEAVAFPVKAVDGAIYYVTLLKNEDSNSGNDSDFVRTLIPHEEGETIDGDVNGDGLLSIQDVTALLLALSKPIPGDGNIALYDVNEDQVISIQDVTKLLQMLAKAA